ncbi:MAG: hypothetical protein ACI8SK_000695, partial [Shewanella sp.]
RKALQEFTYRLIAIYRLPTRILNRRDKHSGVSRLEDFGFKDETAERIGIYSQRTERLLTHLARCRR